MSSRAAAAASRGGESGVAHAVFDGLEVGAAGEEPGGVGVDSDRIEVIGISLQIRNYQGCLSSATDY